MVKVQGYPDLRKNGAAVVNVNHKEYELAKKRKAAAARIDTLEKDVQGLHSKLDTLMRMLHESLQPSSA